MFGLTDADLQVHAIRHKETVARGEAKARLELALATGAKVQSTRNTTLTSLFTRIASLFRASIHSLPADS